MKLATLARDHGATDARVVPGELGVGVGLLAGEDAWVLVDDDPGRGLGPALAWAVRQRATRLHLVAESGTGVLARRAKAFRLPIEVWHADGRDLLPAIAEPLAVSPGLPDGHEQFVELIVAAGATPVVEHGVLLGDVGGLEVCRAVTDADTGAARLEVGIGAHDREAFQLLHGDEPTQAALAEFVASVRPHREPAAAGHPLNRLARSRALRARLVAEPALIGAAAVAVTDPPIPRRNVKDDVPCVALAEVDGTVTTVVCSAGVDLDAVPYAVDARLATGAAPCLVALAAGCDLPIQYELADLVETPLRLVAVQP